MSTLQQRLAALTPQQRNALLGKLAAAQAAAAAAAPKDEQANGLDDGALAPAQQRMWLFDSMQGDSAAYNIASVLRLSGRLDGQALERALNALVRRHAILRTRFVDSDGTPRRVVLAEQPLTLGRATVPPGALDAAIAGLLAAPFRLDAGPLLRVTALTVGLDETVLVAVLHHIVADGWSLRLIETELSAAYTAALQDADPALPPAPQYGEYVRRQRAWLAGAAPRQLDYWQRQLAGAPACWPLPCERPREGAGLDAASLLFELPATLCEAARRLAEAENGSTFMVLAAAFKLVLGRFAGTADVSIGTPVANRRERRFDGMIGMCSNTVVLRSHVAPGTFRAYLRQVRQVALDAFSNQDVPFEQVVDALRPDRSAAYPPLFQVLFALQSTEASALRLPGLEIEAVQLPRRASEFDVIFELFLGAGTGHGVLTWRSQLLAAATVERLRDAFVALLAQALADPDTPVARLLDAQAAPPLRGDPAPTDGAGLLAAHCPLRAGDTVHIGAAVADDMALAARLWCERAGTPVLAQPQGATVLVARPGELAALGSEGRRLVLLHGAEPGAGAQAGAWECWSDGASGPCLLRAPDGTVRHRGLLRCVNALGEPLPQDAPGEWLWQADAAAAGIPTGLAGRVVDGAPRLDGFAPGHAWLDGHRVDLARVEDALVRIPAVSAAAVLPRPDRDGVWRGVAYVVLNQKIEPHALAALLAARVPAAWLPAGYVAVNRLPTLRDGTLDSAALARLPVLNASACARFAAAAGVPAQAVGTAWQAPAVPGPVTYERLPAVARPAQAPAQPAVAADAPPSLAEGPALLAPACAWSLAAMLRAAATAHGTHGITYLDDTAAPARRQSYAELWAAARAVLTGLRGHGVRPGDRVVLQLDDRRDMLTAFWGCVLAGALPVPAAVPARYEDGDKDMEKIVNAWPVLAPALVITQAGADTAPLARRLDLAALPRADIAALCACPPAADWHEGAPDDTALLLLTSGSTGAPKAVRQSHRALISRSQATAQLFGFDSAVVSLNWMPLDHVGGLVMFHLLDVYLGAEQIQCPTGAILAQPLRWLDCLSAHRVTNTWAPNFAYALVNEALDSGAGAAWDLTALDFILNGGESIVPRTARTFLRRLAPYGLRGDAMKPAWGMSETCSGVTFNPAFTLETGTDDDAFVAVGAPVPGVALRIVDGADRLLPEGAEGRLQIRGAPVTAGYFNNSAANEAAFTADGWYVTGDLAALRDGSLTITGREKDVIIVNGLNYHGHELEQIAEEVPDVLEAHVAACAVRGPGHDTDRLALFFSVHERALGDLERVRRALRQALLGRGGIAPTFVVHLAPAEFPRTSIGKIQRLQLAQRFNAGEFDARLDAGTPATLPAWFHAPAWLPAPAPRSARAMPVLLFGTELPADALRHATRLVRVLAGERYARLDADRFTVDPHDTQQWNRLLATLHEETGLGWHIVHAALAPQPDYAALRSVAALARAVAAAQPGHVDALDVVTGAAFVLPGDAGALPEHAALQGFVRSLALELPAVRCRHVDVSAADAGSLSALALEIGSVATHDVVALRPAGRYIQALRACVPAKAPAAPGGPGWCVITGGAGGIGAALAAWLLEHTALHVLVLGRSVPQDAPADPRCERVAQDVCDAAGIAALLAQYQQRWQVPLTHVFHLAGALVEAPVAALDDAALLHALRAKAQGAAVLHEVLADQPGVEIVHFGSANGYFGGAGVAAYAAANAALDALVMRRRAAGGRSRCLHWSMWDEVGMSRGYAGKAQSAARGYVPLAPAQGLDSLWLALAADAPVVLVGLDAASPNVARHVDAPVAAAWALRAPGAAAACDDFGTPLAVAQVGGAVAAAQPLTPMERRLAAVWRDVLRVPVIDAAANFFELGGDSIMAIQLVARAAKAGIGLAPRAIFECQTLAELARTAAADDGADADAAPLTGAVPLAPIQRWFFAQDFAAAHHMNQSVLLRLQRRIAPDVLRQALRALARQHDMLRARFAAADEGIVQHLADDVAVPLDVIAVAPGEAALAQACDGLQASLDLAHGPLLRAGYLQGGAALEDRLLIVAHHLVVDGVSWRILVDDVEHCIAELEQGRVPRLGRKSTAYRDWVATQATQAAAHRDAALAYWRAATAQPGALPPPAGGDNLRGTEQAVELRFDAALTEAVLHALPAAAGVGPDDVLLAAFYEAWRGWASGDRLLLTLEGHGRGGTADGIDVSRTVGWFTAMYPVALDAAHVPLAALPAVLHARLAAVPGAGRPYLALRHGDDAAARAVLAAGHAPAVSFNYLGRFDVEGDRLLRFATEAPGAQIAPRQRRTHELDVVGAVVDGALRMSFIYGAERYPRAAVAALAERFTAALQALAAAPAARRWSVEHPELAAQLAQRGIAAADVDSVLPATPMQAGMLYESQVSGVAGTFVSHLVNELGGDLDAAALRRAWEGVVARHAVYRTAFMPGRDGGMRQVVLRRAALPWVELDWSALPADEQEARFVRLLDDDARAGFAQDRAPLLRIHLVRLAPARHRMLVSEHHCVSDGWSRGVVLADVAALYRGGAALAPAVPFSRYADWLRGFDAARAQAYWDGLLAGAAPLPPFACQAPARLEKGGAAVQRRHVLRLSAALTDRLAEAARTRRVTLAALAQAAWCWTMAAHTGRRDVTFLTVHAGRPPALEGVERIVGPLLATVPVRLDLDAAPGVAGAAHALQRLQVERAEHGFLPLARSSAALGRDGLRGATGTLFVFENFPLTAPPAAAGELEVLWVHHVDRSDLPLAVMVVPGEQLEAVFYARDDCYDEEAVALVADSYERMLEAAAAAPEAAPDVASWMGDAALAERAARLTGRNAPDVAEASVTDFEF